MFKQMKLGAKIGAGFGVLIFISVFLGASGWIGLSRVRNNVDLIAASATIKDSTNKCGNLRREFKISKFDIVPGDEKNAADKWHVIYDELKKNMEAVANSPTVAQEFRAYAGKGLTGLGPYRDAFERAILDEKSKIDANDQILKCAAQFAGVVKDLQGAVRKESQTATESKDVAAMAKWTGVMTQTDDNLNGPYLAMRVAVRIYMQTETEKDWATFQECEKKFADGLAIWTESAKGNPALESLAKKLQDNYTQYEAIALKYHTAVVSYVQNIGQMDAAAKLIVAEVANLDEAIKKKVESDVKAAIMLMLVLLLASVVIGVCLAVFITRGITGPINHVIAGLTQGAEQIASASGQVAQSSQQMAEGASEQASSLEEVSSSLEEMASMTRQNTDNAKQAASQATEARTAAEKGSEVMERMSEAIDKIKVSSDETAKILKTIDEIAFQTNLLALNAAVEAARAGDAGKGFAVVAEEVRNLAMRSAEAARNTATLIEASQKNADNGVTVSADVAQILKQIVGGSQKMTQLNAEVSAASDEQTQGIDQINTAVAQLDKVTQSNAANAEESASAAEELSAQAREMNDMVNMLVSIVRGAAEAAAASRASASRPVMAHAGSSLHHPAAGRKSSPAGGNKWSLAHTGQKTAVKPEEVIPLNDSDLSEF